MVGRDQAVSQRQSHDPAVRVTGEDKVEPQCAVSAVFVVSVRKQQAEGIVLFLRGDLLCKRMGRFLVGVAVGVVDTGDDDALAAAVDALIFVFKAGCTARFQRFDQLRYVVRRPLVIARDIVHAPTCRKRIDKRQEINKFKALPGSSNDKFAVRVTSIIREE